MPLFAAPVTLTAGDLAAAWRLARPDDPGIAVTERGGALVAEAGGGTVAVTFVPGEIPGDEVAQAAESSWLWPDAAAEAAPYAAHGVVFPPVEGEETLAAYIRCARVAAAVVTAAGALGVYVGGACMVVPGEVWTGIARDLPVPLPLWLNLFAGEDGRLLQRSTCYTAGMEQFDQMDVEIVNSRRSPGDLRLWVLDLAAHLVEGGVELADGSTVGASDAERHVVRHAPSETGKPGVVYRIDEGANFVGSP